MSELLDLPLSFLPEPSLVFVDLREKEKEQV
jgi:hypothetical protein